MARHYKGSSQMITASKSRIYCLFTFLTCFATGVVLGATDHGAILQEATLAMNDDYMQEWAYTETTIEAEEKMVGRYDPRQPAGERWQLLSFNDRNPTAQEVADYAEDKEDDNGSSSSENGDHDVSDIAEPDSLRLIEETDDYWLYSFTPIEDEEEEEFMKHIDATMKIVKDGPYIEYIDMHSNKPFKPQFGVKIKEFVTRLRFGRASNDGPVVPLSVDVRIKARAFLAIGIDETISVSFSDYEYVGD
jgi:hypothetical protein